ncbi:MAG: AsmA family protein [Candidatus Abyssobacteria bacterium SURF_17]|uniref:AsmA family protein n=1 Tax=Candidatus Abyssobacteria bacterium SURF_17 TaxID=2093361 RepID=A0A419F941_9BACT|nr:MAG: AsmA family protein [Candidatus Abyssubacteria bacterium SURF_17]
MKRMFLAVLTIVLAISVLAAIALVSIDTLTRKGIEDMGGQTLGVDVSLSRANVSLLGGRLALSGFTISNPEGFKTDWLFESARTEVKARPLALFKEDLLIDSIVIESPSLTIEQSTQGTNMALVLGSMKKDAPTDETAERQKRYRIRTLQIRDAKVAFASSLTAKAPVTIPLPDIELENVSNADGTGLTLA